MRIGSLLSILIAVAGPASAQSVQIELRAESAVTGVHYSLGEIARVRADHPALAQQLRTHRIGRAPRVGQSHGVSRSDVGARVMRAFPDLQGRIEWLGPRLARVEGAGQELVAEDYVPQARATLAAWLEPRFSDFDLEPLESRTPVTVPLGGLTVRPRLPGAVVPRKRMSVWLDFFVDAEHYRSLPLWFAVTASRPGFVAGEDLRAGAHPTPALVRAATVTASGHCEALADEDMLAGHLRLRAAVKEGAPLCAENLARPPAVTRGQPVQVTARSGPVEVQALATALEDGQPGQVIAVRRGTRGKRFAVEVTGINEARVKGDSYE